MSAPLPKDVEREARQILGDLRIAHLAATAWPVVAGDLARLASAFDHGDVDAVRAALVPISQATFEGKVRGRLAGANRAAAYVTATKQTSALPAVGAASAALLMLVGYMLGGWPVAAVTAVFSLFIFSVAYAGSHGNRERLERRHAQAFSPTKERTEPAPSVVAEAIENINQRL
ncbi:MAG: CATRA system-associated protein [Acidimicrobiales bacterium]